MDRWTPYSTSQRHRRNLNQPTIQPDGQPTIPVVSCTTNIDQDYIIAHQQHDSLQNHSYPSINASGNSSLILGNVQEFHYHISRAAAQVREQLLSSLHFREMFVRFDNIEDPHSDTFEWILRPPEDERREHSSFLHWLHSDGSLFWVSGKPGSGKSVLMKHLTQRIREAVKYDEASVVVLSFWFWEAAHQELERSLLGCLRSLLWQLLQVKPHGSSICETIEHNVPFEWTKRRLRDNLANALSMLAQSGVQVYMLLDGVDESGPEASEVLAFIRDISKRCPTIKICVSSRPEPLLQQAFGGCPNLKMQELNLADVYTIVKQDLLEAPELAPFTDCQYELRLLENEIVRDADGVLLWVRIVIRDLLVHAASGDTLGEMRGHLRRLPAELEGEDGLWAFMLRRNANYSKHYLADAALYLQIACHAEVSLLTYRLATDSCLRDRLLRFDKGWEHLHNQIDCARLSKAISARTGGLLEVSDYRQSYVDRNRGIKTRDPALTHLLDVENKRIVRFLHRTARSFLLETKTGQDLLSLYRGTASEIDRILFEVDLITSFHLPCLETVAPMCLNRSWVWRPPMHCSDVALFKYVLGSLFESGLFWTEPYHARWPTDPLFKYIDTYLPLPTLRLGEEKVSFAHLFAFKGWTTLVADEIEQVGMVEDLNTYLFSLLLNILSFGLTFCAGEDFLHILKGCELILSYNLDPSFELINTFGERSSVFACVLFRYSFGSWELPVMEDWLQQAKLETRLLKYEPTMVDCSSSFFYPNESAISVFGVVCSEELQVVCSVVGQSFSTWLNNLEADLAPYVRDDDVKILCIWQSNAWKVPHMYAMADNEYTHILADMLRHQDGCLEIWSVGIVNIGAYSSNMDTDMLLKWVETSEIRMPKVKSLLEAFRLLGKTETSIEAFVAVEEPRIRASYKPEIYREWRSWLYGTEDTATDTQNGASSS